MLCVLCEIMSWFSVELFVFTLYLNTPECRLLYMYYIKVEYSFLEEMIFLLGAMCYENFISLVLCAIFKYNVLVMCCVDI